jgi:hypothetical protein
MRAILIDPFDQTITEINIPPTAVGIRIALKLGEDRYFSSFGLGGPVTGWCDDEGLLLPDQRFVQIGSPDIMQPIGGRVLMTGTEHGDIIPLMLPLQLVRDTVTFPDIVYTHMETETYDHKGVGFAYIKQTAHFRPRKLNA